jgi:hypothetical protein
LAALTPDGEKRKKAVFDTMSERGRKKILARGYDQWDPFMMPKDPLDIRMARQRETALSLMKKFLTTCDPEEYGNAYGQGAWDACMGIIGGEDRWKGVYDFSRWYSEFQKSSAS